MTHNVDHVLTHLIENLIQATEITNAIKGEYEANGNDSLANIDYGAALNSYLRKINNQMKMLDESGLFTMGNDD